MGFESQLVGSMGSTVTMTLALKRSIRAMPSHYTLKQSGSYIQGWECAPLPRKLRQLLFYHTPRIRDIKRKSVGSKNVVPHKIH